MGALGSPVTTSSNYWKTPERMSERGPGWERDSHSDGLRSICSGIAAESISAGFYTHFSQVTLCAFRSHTQMGVFNNISIWTRRCPGPRGLTCTIAFGLLVGWMGTTPSFAGADDFHPERSVSTSPIESPKPEAGDATTPIAGANQEPPLTRAAAQLHIDQMSPTRWLAQFGSVSIGHRE